MKAKLLLSALVLGICVISIACTSPPLGCAEDPIACLQTCSEHPEACNDENAELNQVYLDSLEAVSKLPERE